MGALAPLSFYSQRTGEGRERVCLPGETNSKDQIPFALTGQNRTKTSNEERSIAEVKEKERKKNCYHRRRLPTNSPTPITATCLPIAFPIPNIFFPRSVVCSRGKPRERCFVVGTILSQGVLLSFPPPFPKKLRSKEKKNPKRNCCRQEQNAAKEHGTERQFKMPPESPIQGLKEVVRSAGARGLCVRCQSYF